MLKDTDFLPVVVVEVEVEGERRLHTHTHTMAPCVCRQDEAININKSLSSLQLAPPIPQLRTRLNASPDDPLLHGKGTAVEVR